MDTLPIFISEPSKFQLAKLCFQPKYKRHCYKMQLGCTLMGNICLWTGPHLGCTSDVTIWRQTWQQHPFRSWEAWLGDLGYVGAAGLITKFKKPPKRRRPRRPPGAAARARAMRPPAPPLTRAQLHFNNVHESTRNRVESVVRKVKAHKLFSGRVFKGKYETLRAALHVVGHVAAYQLRQRQRFQSYGPWPHAYGPMGQPNPP